MALSLLFSPFLRSKHLLALPLSAVQQFRFNRFTNDSNAPKPQNQPTKFHKKAHRSFDINTRNLRNVWKCTECAYLNYPSRRACQRCGHGASPEQLVPMWTCQGCNSMNFADRKACFQCRQGRPLDFSVGGKIAEGSSWYCSSCQHLNLAFRNVCQRCEGEPTDEQRQALRRRGIWTCAGCGTNNYSDRAKCKGCGSQKIVGQSPAENR